MLLSCIFWLRVGFCVTVTVAVAFAAGSWCCNDEDVCSKEDRSVVWLWKSCLTPDTSICNRRKQAQVSSAWLAAAGQLVSTGRQRQLFYQTAIVLCLYHKVQSVEQMRQQGKGCDKEGRRKARGNRAIDGMCAQLRVAMMASGRREPIL